MKTHIQHIKHIKADAQKIASRSLDQTQITQGK